MKPTKAGIWMDHRVAYVTEFTAEPAKSVLVESQLNQEKKPNLSFGEIRMHAREQREQEAFFKELSGIVRKYKEVVLFGPGNAKTEFYNMLSRDHLFADIVIKIEPMSKMTPEAMYDYVRKYFSSH